MFGVHSDAGLCGVVGLCHADHINRNAEVSFYIGDEKARGRGYAQQALTLLHGYGFGELNLHRIWAEVYGFNTPGLELLKKLGYVVEGAQRSHIWLRGWHDSHILGLLSDEWHKH
jgi:RimJ/RimL family protein N-acetyltransferase